MFLQIHVVLLNTCIICLRFLQVLPIHCLWIADVVHGHISNTGNQSNKPEQVIFLHFAVCVSCNHCKAAIITPISHYAKCHVIKKSSLLQTAQINWVFVRDKFHDFHLSSPFVKKSWWHQCSAPDAALSLSLEPRCMSFSSQLVPIRSEIQPITGLDLCLVEPHHYILH